MNEFQSVVAEWYEALREPFARLLYSRFAGLDADDVADIYQEAFMAAHDNLQAGRVADGTNWKAYILRIGLNRATTLSRKRASLVAIDGNREAGDDVFPDTRIDDLPTLRDLVADTTDDPAELEQRCQMMSQTVDKLGEPCRSLLIDFYCNDLSLAEIRDEYGYASVNSAKSQRYKCLERLRRTRGHCVRLALTVDSYYKGD